VKLAKTREDPGPVLAADRSLGYALAALGELEAARACFDRVTSSYDFDLHREFSSRLGGADFGVGSYVMNAWNLDALGYPDQALVSVKQGLELAKKLDHPLSEAFGHFVGASVHLLCGEPETARDKAKAGTQIAVEKGLVQYDYWNKVMLCSALFELDEGDPGDNIAGIREAIEACRALGTNLLNPHFLSLLARAYGQNKQPEEGLAAVEQGLGEIDRTGERLWEAELHHLKGQLLLESDSTNVYAVETCFRSAIDIARSQKAKSWELRAATSLARLWRDQSKPDDARDLLTPVFDWFTEGFETTDLKGAKELLDELA
jgi:tetratricopeptide (TPR) repeat protein